MPAGTDLIFFDNPEDWQTIVNTSRTAQIVNENSHTPIPAFDLGVTLNDEYIAVVAGTTQGKPTWRWAGDISQVYDFAPGGSNPILGNIQPERSTLWINTLLAVETTRISTDSFRLRYAPPAWFKDCTIKVYKYTGDKLNFVEDSLFSIGNALGVDPNNPEGLVALGLAAIRDDIDQSFQELRERLDNDESIEEAEFDDIQTQLNQIDAGIFTLAEGISRLLPPGQGEDITRTTQSRLNLDLGFL
ncbi:MAG: hypothetical protein AAGA16_07600 [Cyanobacteria bacterium P01_E01_bin.35]